MKIVKSTALKQFKKEIGQANHFLITILVGLDGVKSGKIEKNDEFDVVWNPKNVEASVNRSRIYAIKASLAWTVDCLDMYLRLCNKKPKLLSEELSGKFDGTGHSVYEKYRIIANEYTASDIDTAIVDLLICWRNRMIHFDADNDILKISRDILKTKLDDDERAQKCHLNIEQMLNSFDQTKCPTFKEMAFLIRKTICFVESIDKMILDEVNIINLLDDTLCFILKKDQHIFKGIFSTEGDRRKQKLNQFIKTCGFVEIENNSKEERRYIDQICQMSFKEAKDKIMQGTFIK